MGRAKRSGDDMSMQHLTGKVAIVTGSTQGLGADIARGLVQAGASVTILGRGTEAGESLARELGARAIFCPADIGRDADIARSIDA
jgi:NADP-dependent 3-hydroxy acid dehydrogenase YdfG